VFTATEANQANELVSKYTVNGDVVVHGQTGLKTISTGGSGNNNKVLVADSTVADGGVKWAQINNDGVASDAAIALSKLATGALPTSITVASANLVNGTVALEDLATAVANALVPVGTIAMYGGAAAPTGWLLCDGTSTTGYTALAAIVGASTPDLRGRFALGDSASLTLLAVGGSTTIGTNNLPSHQHTFSATTGGMSANATLSHSVTDPGHAHTINGQEALSGLDFTGAMIDSDSPGSAYTESTASATTGITVASHTVSHTHTVSGDTGNTGGAEAYFQPHVVVNYIIKHD
jgi:microcystin-dependent protein